MRFRHLAFAVFFSGWFTPSFAETGSAQDALPLPDAACSYAGNFTQDRYLSGITEPIRTAGQFYFHCEYGVVWATQEPIKDVLILHRNGRGLQVSPDQAAQKLKSRQSKFLGQLLTTLMAGDQAALRELFEISATETAYQYQLLPRQRKLKRGIQHLVLDLAQLQPLLDQSEMSSKEKALGIEILDRNHQTTRIAATQTRQFEPTDNAAAQCASMTDLGAEYCDLLFGL